MQIVASQLQLTAAHSSQQRLQVSERITFRSTELPRTAATPEPTPVPPSATAEASGVGDSEATLRDPDLAPLIRLIELLTGRRVRLFELPAAAPPNAAPSSSLAGEAPRMSPAAAGGETRALRYEAVRRYEEVEASVFRARGSIVTADGERIDFSLQLEMSRAYREETRLLIERGPVQRKDPLVINLDVPAARLADTRFRFDLDADGREESLPGLAAGSGYLVLDRNRNGRIDDGRELFGALSGDGFADLAALDGDGNGWIDEGDAAFADLRLVRNPVADAGTGVSLADAGVAAISTARIGTPFELRGSGNSELGAIRASGVYLAEDRRVGSVQQLDLSV